MANSQAQMHSTSKDGDEVRLTLHSTDSPILPGPLLRELHEFRPDLVDFIVEQTKEEAEYRRKRARRQDLYVFCERISAVVSSVIITLTAIIGAVYMGLHDQPWVAATIVSGTIAAIVTAIMRFHKPAEKIDKPQQTPKTKRRSPARPG